MSKKRLKVLFINPSLRRGSPTKYLPVGIGSVMTLVRRKGIEFDLLDVDIYDHDDEYVEKFISENQYDVILTGAIVTHYKWIKWLTFRIREHLPVHELCFSNIEKEIGIKNIIKRSTELGLENIKITKLQEKIENQRFFSGIRLRIFLSSGKGNIHA